MLKLKLTSRVIEARGEKINSKFNVQQAEFARDALAKAIYSRLFDYLVEVNFNYTLSSCISIFIIT